MMMWMSILSLFLVVNVVSGRVFGIRGWTRMTSPALAERREDRQRLKGNPPSLEVHPLHISGHPTNRVNLVFFADGYIHQEREKFLSDAHRLAKDLTANQTFAPVLPLLNFYAAFTPSLESGIGVGGKQKETVFGLYRDGTELRGVYPGKLDVAHADATLLAVAVITLYSSEMIRIMEACYIRPVMFHVQFINRRSTASGQPYIGLGGEVSITTSSILNGPLVLRHELGHSIIDVGEEYDGGTEYFGANSSPNLTVAGFKWAHWLSGHHSNNHHSHSESFDSPSSLRPLDSSSKPSLNTSNTRAERATMPHQSYPWTLLNHTEPYTIHFNSTGSYHSYLIRTSLSGFPHATHLRVALDGVDLGWTPREEVGLDRWFYDLVPPGADHGGLNEGNHVLTFTLGENADEEFAQLCSVEVLEYGKSPDEFDDRPGVISAFPTFSESFNPDLSVNTHSPHSLRNDYAHEESEARLGTTYRPTNEGCLMRQVTFPNFCSPCLESLWLYLLEHVDLIDDLAVDLVDAHEDDVSGKTRKRVYAKLRLVPFGEGSEGRAMLGSLPNVQLQTQTQTPLSRLFADMHKFGQHPLHSSETESDNAFKYNLIPEHLLPPPSYAPHPGSESYEIIWKKNGAILDQFANATFIVLDIDEKKLEGKGLNMEVELRLHTADVRLDVNGRLISRRAF